MFKSHRLGDLQVNMYGDGITVISDRHGHYLGLSDFVGQFVRRVCNLKNGAELWDAVGRSDEIGTSTSSFEGIIKSILGRLSVSRVGGSGSVLSQIPKLAEFSVETRTPLLGMLEITYACNERCEHCYVLHKVSEKKPSSLSTEKAREVISAMADLGCIDISITGGETTLHSGYRDLISYAKDRHLFTTLKTNATTMTASHAEKYRKDPAHQTQVSLYGSTADVHDAMTKQPGSFVRTVRGLKELSRVGITCDVFVTFWRANAHQAREMKNLIEDMGHVPSFDADIHGRLNGDRHPLTLTIDTAAREDLIKSGYIRRFEPSPCTAGMMKFKVAADGNVATCELLPQSVGNVHDRSVQSIWTAEATRHYGAQIINISHSPSILPTIRESPTSCSCPGFNLLNTGRPEGIQPHASNDHI